jgi:NAD-dependent dihydropyrimidine dehydrogenase PreA subunit
MVTLTENSPVLTIDLELCDGCGICVEACPAGTFELKGGKAVVSAGGKCDYYGNCELLCPTGAISKPPSK